VFLGDGVLRGDTGRAVCGGACIDRSFFIFLFFIFFSVRDAETPDEVLAAARALIEHVEAPCLREWYSSVVRPWDKRPL
jgi:hypothetical protein